MYSEIDSKDPVSIAQNAIKEARAKGYDLVMSIRPDVWQSTNR